MKKILLSLVLVAGISACENISQMAAGTLFTQGISATAKELVGTCTKKLALESAGISEESQSMATSIIQNLQNFGSVQ